MADAAPAPSGFAARWARMDRRYFRYIRYLFYTLWTDFLIGGLEKRRHFIGRIGDAASKRLFIDQLTWLIFMLCLKICDASLPADQKRWQHRRWLWAVNRLEIREYLAKWTQDVSPTRPIRIVIFGAGGIGDLIQTTPILAAMRQKLPDAEIVFLHRSPAVKSILGDNPNINAVGFASFSDAAKLRDAIATNGIGDFLLELESGTYVGVYTLAPAPVRSKELDTIMPYSFFEQAAVALKLRCAKPDFRRADGTYSWPHEWRSLSFLDSLGMTTGLPVDRHSPFYFKLSEQDAAFAPAITEGKKVITVQNGVDDAVVKWMHVTERYASKLMPLAIWKETVAHLRQEGYFVIQLGTADDDPIEGVSLDIRGKTNLRQAGAIMQHAICHVGTEGGLIHIARAVGTRSVVMFGPTSSTFFGYDENINLTEGSCNSCWQSARDWYIYCPRGFLEPPCMAQHSPNRIIEAVKQIENTAKL